MVLLFWKEVAQKSHQWIQEWRPENRENEIEKCMKKCQNNRRISITSEYK